MNEQLILASASPRRKELLDQIGVSYIVHTVDVDETPKVGEFAIDYVVRIAAEKSAVCLNELHGTLPILAADTSVVIDGHILGKPRDKADALSMLKQLSGKTHTVYSAVSLRCKGSSSEFQHFQVLSKTEVQFRQITTKEMHNYWATGEPQGKAGGYAIQGLASIFVESITGSFSGVVGLPLFETAQLLFKQGINILHE
ncbi:MAG: septum formation inhibitor Maf [Methylococcales bacterium]|nr:septum formation inhibitor Maf [Methylococcales bacterium]